MSQSKLDNIKVNVTPTTKETIKKIADLDSRSVSNYLRVLLEEYFSAAEEFYEVNHIAPQPRDLIAFDNEDDVD